MGCTISECGAASVLGKEDDGTVDIADMVSDSRNPEETKLRDVKDKPRLLWA